MAKKQTISNVSLEIGGDTLDLNENVRYKFDAIFNITHDKNDDPREYTARYDLEMSMDKILELARKTIIILDQKKGRDLDPSEAEKLFENVRTYNDVFPGRKTVVKTLSLAEMKEKAKNDPIYKEELIKMMQDLME